MENNTGEIIEAIQDLAQHVDQKFNESKICTDKKFDELKTGVTELKTDVTELKTDVAELKMDVGGLKTGMITKGYLDEKLFDLRGDLILVTRKEDQKVDRVIHKLKEKNIFSDADTDELLTVTPFPR